MKCARKLYFGIVQHFDNNGIMTLCSVFAAFSSLGMRFPYYPLPIQELSSKCMCMGNTPLENSLINEVDQNSPCQNSLLQPLDFRLNRSRMITRWEIPESNATIFLMLEMFAKQYEYFTNNCRQTKIFCSQSLFMNNNAHFF